jgi:hypothetical protein
MGRVKECALCGQLRCLTTISFDANVLELDCIYMHRSIWDRDGSVADTAIEANDALSAPPARGAAIEDAASDLTFVG